MGMKICQYKMWIDISTWVSDPLFLSTAEPQTMTVCRIVRMDMGMGMVVREALWVVMSVGMGFCGGGEVGRE